MPSPSTPDNVIPGWIVTSSEVPFSRDFDALGDDGGLRPGSTDESAGLAVGVGSPCTVIVPVLGRWRRGSPSLCRGSRVAL